MNADSTVELCVRYRLIFDDYHATERRTDDENDCFVDDVLEPLERELAKAAPTTRAGTVALLDIALDKEYPGSPAEGARVLINNARDALAGAARAAPEDLERLARLDDGRVT